MMEGGNSRIHGHVLNLMLVADMLFASHLYAAMTLALQPILLGFVALVSCIYAGIAVSRGYVSVFSIFVMLIAMTLFQLWIFSYNTNAELKINSAFQFVIFCDFIFYFVLAKDGMMQTIVNRLVIVSTFYLLVYLVMSICFKAGILPKDLVTSLILTDDERGDRLFMYGGASAIGWYFWLSRLMTRFSARNLFFVAICAADYLLCLSRVAELCTIILSLLYILRMQKSFISATCLVILGGVSLVYFAGIFDLDFNPFSIFAGDSSGGARAIEYDFSRIFIAKHLAFGLGISSSPLDLALATSNDYFASSDLGTIGVWLDFGILGVILYAAASYMICTFRPYPSSPSYMNDALFLTGCSIGVYSCLSPGIFYQPAANTSAVLIGLWLAAPRQIRKQLAPDTELQAVALRSAA